MCKYQKGKNRNRTSPIYSHNTKQIVTEDNYIAEGQVAYKYRLLNLDKKKISNGFLTHAIDFSISKNNYQDQKNSK